MKYVNDDEIDFLRSFHKGEFGRCAKCGHAVFLPCRACETEETTTPTQPVNAESVHDVVLDVELYGEERRRYEIIRNRKIKAETCTGTPSGRFRQAAYVNK